LSPQELAHWQTGCRDKQAVEKVLADILAGVDRVRAGVMSHDEMTASDQLEAPTASGVAALLTF
jgi:hypothetical protein